MSTATTIDRPPVAPPENEHLPTVTAQVIPTALADIMEDVVVLDVMRQIRDRLNNYIDEFLEYGEDYGIIPGTKTVSLYKSGAKKLEGFFQVMERPVLTSKVEDW